MGFDYYIFVNKTYHTYYDDRSFLSALLFCENYGNKYWRFYINDKYGMTKWLIDNVWSYLIFCAKILNCYRVYFSGKTTDLTTFSSPHYYKHLLHLLLCTDFPFMKFSIFPIHLDLHILKEESRVIGSRLEDGQMK